MIGGKIVPKQSFVFPIKHVFDLNFFTKLSPHLFSGPNGLYGAFGGKTILDKIFAQFCLESPRNRFSEKHVFGLNFFMKALLTYFRGQTDCMAQLGVKLFRNEVSFFRKNTFSIRIFLRNYPLIYFRGQTDCIARLGANLFRTKISLDFASKAPKIIFPKNMFSVRIFLRNCTSAIFRAKRTIWCD